MSTLQHHQIQSCKKTVNCLQGNLIKLLHQTKSLKVTVSLNTSTNNCQDARVWMCQMLQQTDNYSEHVDQFGMMTNAEVAISQEMNKL